MGRLKHILLLVFAIVILINATACGKEKELSGKITLWVSDTMALELEGSVAKFKTSYPKVTIEIVSKEQKYIQTSLMVGIPANQNLPDIVAVEDDKIQTLVRRFPKGFMESTEILGSDKEKILKSKISNLTFEEGIYGIPWNIEPLALCYRADVLKSTGIVPEEIKTWQDFIEVGAKISKETTPNIIAILDEEQFGEIVVQQQGEVYVDKEGKISISKEKNEKATAILKKMKDTGLVYKAQSIEALTEVLKSEETFSTIVTPSQVRAMIDDMQVLRGKWQLMKLPSVESGGGRSAALNSMNLMVLNESSNKKVSAAFLKFAIEDEETQLMMFNKYGIMNCNTSLYDAKEFSQYSGYFKYQKIWELFKDIANQLPNTIYKNTK